MASLQWIGKDAVVGHHRDVPYHLLKPDSTRSVGEGDGQGHGIGSGNLLVQGDNLLALKALLPYYAGKVKCIYIDPPYNTGNEKWVYNDNVNSPEIRQWLGKVVGKEGETLDRHDRWLCMMYPRLALLKEFLAPDGVIWVSMDESEPHLLRMLMDEVFDRARFLSSVIWKKRSSPDARATIGNVHDYLMCYVNDPREPKKAVGKLKLSQKRVDSYDNQDNDPRGPWASVDMTGMTGRATAEQYYELTLPSGRTVKPPEGRSWGLAEATFLAMRADNRIWFGKNGNNVPRMKKFLSESEGQVIPSFWGMEDVGTNDEAKKQINEILERPDAFDTPKPVELLERILQVSTAGVKDAIVMDSFGGSGTTAHALLAMNHSDGGNRRFITIEMDETIARDITAQRLKKIIEGYEIAGGRAGGGRAAAGGRRANTVPGLGGGFRFVTLGDPVFNEDGQVRPGVRFAELAAHIFFTETGEPIPKSVNGKRTPLIGTVRGTAYYLLFNGILGDKRPDGGNVLTGDVLDQLPAHDGPRVVFGEACKLGAARLTRARVTFRQIPYQIQMS
ncbi:MAG: site-specific DNA-methyltransferase [Pirellulales bacterium]